MTKDPLGVLGLEHLEASPSRIKARYRELAKSAHPDAPGGSAEAMAALSDAFRQALAQAIDAKCFACAGTGKTTVAAGFSSVTLTCKTCHGARRRWNDG